MTDRWIGRVKPDPRWREENPYLNPASGPEPVTSRGPASIADISEGFITLQDIRCVDADRNVMESYSRIEVMTDIEKHPDGGKWCASPYDGAARFEEMSARSGQEIFLPSMALTCNILAALYTNRDNREVKNILEQYDTKPDTMNHHMQNTIIDGQIMKIIHYPSKADFRDQIRGWWESKEDLNTGRPRRSYGLAEDIPPSNVTLEQVLHYTPYRILVKNLTGLQNPDVLVEIAGYFGKTGLIDVVTRDLYAVMIGCNPSHLCLLASGTVGSMDTVRGVRIPKVNEDD